MHGWLGFGEAVFGMMSFSFWISYAAEHVHFVKPTGRDRWALRGQIIGTLWLLLTLAVLVHASAGLSALR